MSPRDPRHWQWREEACPAGPVVIFDIDGVLSDASARQHFLEGPGRKNWRGFFDAAGEDPLIEEVGRLLELLDKSLVVVLLTGRPMRIQPLTLDWLDRNELRWDLLIMRPDGDYGRSTEFKRRAVKELRERDFDIRLAFEDETRNRDMFHEEGIPCIYLHSGYYQ